VLHQPNEFINTNIATESGWLSGWFSFESEATNTLHTTYEIPCLETAFVFHQIGCFRRIGKNLENFLLKQDRQFPHKNIVLERSHLPIPPIKLQNRATTEGGFPT
jgi:hypothetical protein